MNTGEGIENSFNGACYPDYFENEIRSDYGLPITSWVPGATIGVGHLILQSEWNLYANGITAAQSQALLIQDLNRFETSVNNSINRNLSSNEFDALVSLAFNIGVSAFENSSVVTLINNPLNTTTGFADLESAWRAWDGPGPISNPGLVNRRAAEWDLFQNGTY